MLSKTSWVQKNTSSGVCPILGEGEVRPHTYTSHLDTGLLPDFAKRNIGRITQKWNWLPSREGWKPEKNTREVDGSSEHTLYIWVLNHVNVLFLMCKVSSIIMGEKKPKTEY